MQPAAIMRALIFHEKFVGAYAPFLSSSTASVIYVSQVPEVDVYISISFFLHTGHRQHQRPFCVSYYGAPSDCFHWQWWTCTDNFVRRERRNCWGARRDASYYVFGVEYPKMCRVLLFFFQDILMERPDMHGPAKRRPTRYKTFISRL